MNRHRVVRMVLTLLCRVGDEGGEELLQLLTSAGRARDQTGFVFLQGHDDQ